MIGLGVVHGPSPSIFKKMIDTKEPDCKGKINKFYKDQREKCQACPYFRACIYEALRGGNERKVFA